MEQISNPFLFFFITFPLGKGHQTNQRSPSLPRMEALVRIGNIPIVNYSYKNAEWAYNEIKKQNVLFNWSLETAEGVFFTIVDSVGPAVKIIEGPLNRIDQLLCTSLDIVEQRVPQVYLPPESVSENVRLKLVLLISIFLTIELFKFVDGWRAFLTNSTKRNFYKFLINIIDLTKI